MVLGTAESIVIEQGLGGLTMRKIAIRMGYTVGSIYMVFANMADLLMHIKARTLDDIVMQLEQAQDGAAEYCIEALVKVYLRYAGRNFNRWSMLFGDHLSETTEISEWYQEKVDAFFAPVEAQFALLAPDYSDAQKKQAARALWAGVHGICVLSVTAKQDKAELKDIEERVVLLARHFLSGWVACSDK